jgi:cytochrome c oxidase subunit 2
VTLGRILALLSLITAGVIALILWRPDMPWILPVGASAEAEGIDNLFLIMMILSAIIFIFVQGFLIYFALIFRRKPEDGPDAVGRNLHGDNRLEIAWTVAPAIIVVVLTILSFRELDKLRLNEVVPGAHNVDVIGYQFAWDFIHPETGIREANVLTLEAGQEVTLAITGRDVSHAFWVPEFRLKQDATPGYVRRITFTPLLPHNDASFEGKYPEGFPLRCAELCGAGHSQMVARVRVLSSDEYAAWQAEQIEAMNSAPDGATVYQQKGCIGCHQLDAVGAVGAVGPTHNGMGATAEARIADPTYTGTATTAEEYLIESIRDPNAFVVPNYPAGVMQPYPPDQINDAELEALVQFMLEQ